MDAFELEYDFIQVRAPSVAVEGCSFITWSKFRKYLAWLMLQFSKRSG